MKEFIKYFRTDNYKTFLEVDCKEGEIFTNLNSNIDGHSWDAWAVGRDPSLLADDAYLHKFHTCKPLADFHYVDKFDKAYYDLTQSDDTFEQQLRIISNTLNASKEAYFKFSENWELFKYINRKSIKCDFLDNFLLKAESGYPIHYIPIEKLKYMTECSFFPHPNAKNCTDFFDRHDGWRKILQSGENVPEKTVIEERINQVFESIKEFGMKNPLIVKDGLDGFFYVMIGNQRLTIHRALEYEGTLACRISPKLDPWDVNSHVLKLHPYEKVDDIYGP